MGGVRSALPTIMAVFCFRSWKIVESHKNWDGNSDLSIQKSVRASGLDGGFCGGFPGNTFLHRPIFRIEPDG